MHILLHGTWLVKQMRLRDGGGVGFEERIAYSSEQCGAVEAKAGSSIAIEGRQDSVQAGWLTPLYFSARDSRDLREERDG